MEHCVSCKGCKRECENAVDLAAIKVEYLAQCNALEGVPVRTRLFAFLPRYATVLEVHGRRGRG